VLLVALAALIAGAAALPPTARADGTGAPTQEMLEKLPHLSKEEDMAQVRAKLERELRLIAQRESKKGTMGTMGEPGGQPPPNYYLGTVNVPQSPVANDNRVCVHCGPASTLIALRYCASTGRLSPDDMSQFNDPTALKKLGDGYLNGETPTVAPAIA
jgi:hypothetical protein